VDNGLIQRWLDRVSDELIMVLDLETKAVSKERPRVGKSGHVYTPKRTRGFEKLVARSCLIQKPVTYPIKVFVSIMETPPKTWPVEKRQLALAGLIVPTRGDLDNQLKAITDGLNGLAYVDDVQITAIEACRCYGINNRITVHIKQAGLSSVQIDHAVASMKAENGKTRTDRSST